MSTPTNMYGVGPYKETKGEAYRGEPMRKHFTKLLGAWKQELMTSVDQTVDQMKDQAADSPDSADRASQEEEFALELRNRDRERKLIKKIDKTLQMIQDDEYGWCESCGIEIGLRRLEARPTAELCFDCEEIAEKKEKTVGKG
ncbi:RNA polymerase-binding protein DksA [Streptomyces sp. NPDC059564]|uniref:RNA polymerase-binding protein DksA n=1 Tax=Streptomyces sp. NPDC059564 TaxID=3346865 RepID=UPI0036C6DD4F